MGTLSDPNRFEVGDLVRTLTGRAGIVDSFATIIDRNGYGKKSRYYTVRMLDMDGLDGEHTWWSGPAFESQVGDDMTKLPSVEEVLGEGYLA